MSSWKSRYGKKNKKQKRNQITPPPSVQAKRFGDTVVVRDMPGQARMSEVIMEFLEPYSEYWETEDELRKLVSLATIAWNAALFPIEARAELLTKAAETQPPEIREQALSIIVSMILRKDLHFANIKRMILSYEVSMRASGPYLEVMSTIQEP